MPRQRYECTTGGCRKFWEITWADRAAHFVTHWGRIGAAGMTKTKTFQTTRQCVNERLKLVASKLRKSYVLVHTWDNISTSPLPESQRRRSPSPVSAAASLAVQSADDAPEQTPQTGGSSPSGRPRRRVRFS